MVVSVVIWFSHMDMASFFYCSARAVYVHHFTPSVSLLAEGKDYHELRVHHDSDEDKSTHSVDYNQVNPEPVPSQGIAFQPPEAPTNGQSSTESVV